MLLDEVCASDVGEPLIGVSLADPDARLVAHTPIDLTIDYGRLTTGVVLPLVITISSGRSAQSFRRILFSRVAPEAFTFTPREGGRHLVRVAELYHQRWWGYLYLEISGARLREGTL